MTFLRVSTAVVLLACALGAAGQTQQEQVPPGITRAQRAEQKGRADMPPPLPPHVNLPSAQDLKRDADELSRLAQQIPGEVEALNKGVLNKELDAQLKQIEKLSKKLRQEVRP